MGHHQLRLQYQSSEDVFYGRRIKLILYLFYYKLITDIYI